MEESVGEPAMQHRLTHHFLKAIYLDNGSGNIALFGADARGNNNQLNVYNDELRLFEEYVSNRVKFYKVLIKCTEDWRKQHEQVRAGSSAMTKVKIDLDNVRMAAPPLSDATSTTLPAIENLMQQMKGRDVVALTQAT